MLLQAIDGLEGTDVAGGWSPLALAAAGTLLLFVLGLPGMPFHVSPEVLEATAYAPDGRGFGTAHDAEVRTAEQQHARRRARGAGVESTVDHQD